MFLTALVAIGGTSCKKHVTPFDEAVAAVGSPEFFEREQVARWLLVYDTVALLAETDGVEAPLCWEQEGVWHVRAGQGLFRLESGQLVAYEGPEAVDSDAMLRAIGRVRNLERKSPDFDLAAYPRRTEEGIEVWLVPKGVDQVVIGKSWRYLYSATGRELLDQETWNRGSQVVGPDSELDLTLQSEEPEHPTVAELFFALYHRDAFKSVTIETSKYRVTPMDLGGSLGWGRSAL